MKVRFFDPGLGYSKIKGEVLKEFDRVCSAGDLILRDDVEMFEQKLADYVGTKYAVALNSGTDAIMLSLKATLKRDDNVALPSHTFKSTCGAVLSAEMRPVIFDMDGTFEYSRPCQGWIAVHIAGVLDDVPVVEGKVVIEDACQALGAVFNPISDVQCWSFYPAKLLGSLGDGGAITTNDELIYEYVREARNHFKGDNRDFGINSRMDNLQAAFLNIKFNYIDHILGRREEIAERYKALDGVQLPNYKEGRVWQDYIIRTEKRDELFDFLKAQGVETMKNEYPFSPEYPKPTLAKQYESETLRIPCNENLTNKEVDYVISKINEFSNV